MIVIIDYGVGNLTSIKNMLKRAGAESVISNNADDIAIADKLILPGVGAFDYGMGQLRNSSFFDLLNQRVLEDKIPVLGICLGAQLLTRGSEEGKSDGLGWIDAETIRFRENLMDDSLKIPHMGWNDVCVVKNSKLFDDMHADPRFYLVHSYHLSDVNPDEVLVTCNHGYDFVAGVEKNNILGVQFHPEKSHKYGMKILQNFALKY
jgi:imidazole glycerol-phosphate synthase subunit HisH